MNTSGNTLRFSLGLSNPGSGFFRRQLHLNNWHIPELLIIGVIWSTPSETLHIKTYHSSCPDLMSSARFEVTWRNKNIQFISGPLKLIERAAKKSSGPIWVFIMLVKLCYPTGNARVSDNNIHQYTLYAPDSPRYRRVLFMCFECMW